MVNTASRTKGSTGRWPRQLILWRSSRDLRWRVAAVGNRLLHGRGVNGRPAKVTSTWWRSRAEQLRGEFASDPSWTLSASEIGAYTFCPQAWYLQRRRVPVTPEADARRQAGSGVHHAIGRQTDAVRAAGAAQAVLLVAIGVMLLLLAVL